MLLKLLKAPLCKVLDGVFRGPRQKGMLSLRMYLATYSPTPSTYYLTPTDIKSMFATYLLGNLPTYPRIR